MIKDFWNATLKSLGVIKQHSEVIPVMPLNLNLFDLDVAATQAAHRRRVTGHRKIENNEVALGAEPQRRRLRF